MRNCGVSFAEGFKTPPPPNGGPPPLSGEAYGHGAPERGAGSAERRD